MKIKELYSTLEIEDILNKLNEKLKIKDASIFITITQRVDDGAYQITLTKECIEDMIGIFEND